MPEKQWSRRVATCSVSDDFYWLQASPSLLECLLAHPQNGPKTAVSFVKMLCDSSVEVLQKCANYKSASCKCIYYISDYHVHSWFIPQLSFKVQAPISFHIYRQKAHTSPLSQSAALHAELSLWFCNILAKSQLLKEIRWRNFAPLTVPSWHLFYCFMYCGIKRDYLLIIPCSLQDRWGGEKANSILCART